MDDPEVLLNQYLHEERARGRSPQGIIGMRVRTPLFFRFLAEQNITLSELRAHHALAYQGWLRERRTAKGTRYSPNTVAAYRTSAASFCDYVKQRGIIVTNPFKEIRSPRQVKKLPRNIPKERAMNDFLEVLSHFETGKTLQNQITRYRVHVIAEFMYSTALRISEVATIRLDDVDFTRGIVTVQEGKGGVSRIAYLNEYAKELLRLYVEHIRPWLFNEWNERNGELLFGIQWAWLDHAVNDTLKGIAVEAGFEPITSHVFRHAVGFHLLRAGCNIRHIQQILGHKKLGTTEIYTKVEQEDLKEVLDTYHPRGSWKGIEHE